MSTEQEQPSGDSQVQGEGQDVGTPSDELDESLLQAEGLDGEQSEGEDDLEEDLDGLTVRGKKEQIEKLKAERLMQADYTRKTQEVAEFRKQAEADRQSFETERQVHMQNLQEVATMRAIEMQLSNFGQVNWAQLYDQDPAQAAKLDHQMRHLQSQREQLRASVSQRHEQFTQAQQQEAARQVAEGQRVLQRDIPGWGPDLAAKLSKFALANGYTEREVAAIRSPAMVRSIYREYQVAEAKKQATTRTPQVQAAPVTRVSSASKSRAVVDPDKLSTEQWMKWRNAQVKR